MLGTARYLAETKQDPQAFIRAVCSPKGTTEAGMKKLEASSTAAALEKTLAAAAKRSAELK
jgi:pyrroline-5-carboxylate reductase